MSYKGKITRMPKSWYNPKYYFSDRKVIFETLKGTPYYHIKNAEWLMKFRAAGIRWDIVENAIDEVWSEKVNEINEKVTNNKDEQINKRPNMMPDLLTDAQWEKLEEENAKWADEYINVLGHPYSPNDDSPTADDNIAFERNMIRNEERNYRIKKGNWNEEDEIEFISSDD
jgi:hypothetical protein